MGDVLLDDFLEGDDVELVFFADGAGFAVNEILGAEITNACAGVLEESQPWLEIPP